MCETWLVLFFIYLPYEKINSFVDRFGGFAD